MQYLDCERFLPFEADAEQWARAVRRLMLTVGWKMWNHRVTEIKQKISRYKFSRRELTERHFLELEIERVYRRLMLTGRLPHPSVETSFALTTARFLIALEEQLTPEQQAKLHGAIRSALKTPRGFGPLNWELIVLSALCGQGCRIGLADLSGVARYDFLCETADEEAELECKQVTLRKGLNDKSERGFHLLCEAIEDKHLENVPTTGSVWLVHIDSEEALPRNPDEVDRLAKAVTDSVTRGRLTVGTAVIDARTIGEWTTPPQHFEELREAYASALDEAKADRLVNACFFGDSKSPLLVGLSGRTFDRARTVTAWERFLRKTCEQFSGNRPSGILVEFSFSPRVFGSIDRRKAALTARASYLSIISEALESVGSRKAFLGGINVSFGGYPFTGGDTLTIRNPHATHVPSILASLAESHSYSDDFSSWRNEWEEQWLGE